MRYEEFIEKNVEKLTKDGYIHKKEFPSIDLYMDQVQSFMDTQLAMYKKTEKETILTNTMINNYTKHNVMPKSKNKKYTRNHLIFLTFIYHLKGVLQINDIEKLVKPLMENYTSELDDKIDLMDLYSVLLENLKDEKEYLNHSLSADIDQIKKDLAQVNLGDDDMLEMFVLITTLAVKANVHKYMAEQLLQQFFAQPPKQKDKKAPVKKVKERKAAKAGVHMEGEEEV